MYGKIFDSMYDGTISANWQGLVTFQQMIVLCDADGTIDMTPPAISRRTGIPLDIIEAGIEYLEAPDRWSRTPDFDGARIVRLDEHRPWGWFIVNHEKYKNIKDADTVRDQTRLRVKKHREKKKLQENQQSSNGENVTVTQGNAPLRHTDTDTDTDTDKKETTYVDAPAATTTCPHQKIVDSYHTYFPVGPKVKVITDKRKRSIKARWVNGGNGLEFWDAYFAHAAKSRFLTGNNDRNWIADFDFFIRPDTATFMQEGKYHK